MAIPDDALGLAVDFPTDDFINAIRFAEQMGRNPDDAKRIKFMSRPTTGPTYWLDDTELDDEPLLDFDGNPLNPNIEVRLDDETEILDADADDEPIPVDCAIEVEPREALETPVGNFRPTKVVVTLLGAQYQLVKDCRKIYYNGDEYMFGYEPESVGLFDVAVYTMVFYAKDDG